MAIKNIYNSTTLECLKEVLNISLAVVLNDDFVIYSLDPLNSSLTFTSLANSLNGSKGIYLGNKTISYKKVNLENLIPSNIVFGLIYPTTFDILKNYLLQDYGFLIEENDFLLLNNSDNTSLKSGSILNASPDASKNIYLKTSIESGRWLPDSIIKIKLTNY